MNRRCEMVGPSEPFQIAERPINSVPPNGLILKTHYAGVCHSDAHMSTGHWNITDSLKVPFYGENPHFKFPHVLGHEISGEVYKLGSNYSGALKEGDYVMAYPWMGCDDCEVCEADDQYWCKDRDFHQLGVGVGGGFQQYVTIRNAKNALKVPKDFPMDTAALLPCSGLTAYNAVCQVRDAIEKQVKRSGSANLLIVGAGGLGIWGIQWAKALLPKETKVYVADITEEKVDAGKESGADEGIIWDLQVPDEELIEAAKKQTGGGIDAAIDFVGAKTTLSKAFYCCRRGATVVIIGLRGGEVSLSIPAIVFNLVQIQGVLTGRRQQLKDALNIYNEKKIRGPAIARIKLEDVQKAIDDLLAYRVTGRNVVDFVNN